MNRILNRFQALPLKKKVRLIAAILLVSAFIAMIPVYAWFTGQKRAAEMFKIKYPNALYINAAHREDRVFFDLDSIDVNAYEKDEWGNTIYYVKNDPSNTILYALDGEERIMTDEYGHPVYNTTDGEAHKITSKQYAFSVSGKGMSEFTLQLAHTNNNKFIYKIYEATQYTDKQAAIAAASDLGNIVTYSSNKNSHNENTLQVAHDPYDDSADSVEYYYVRQNEPIDADSSGYKNNNDQQLGIRDTDNSFYKETYGTYDTENVHEDAMPSYWQHQVSIHDDEKDSQNAFSKYFILEVTWDEDNSSAHEKKETDMIYLSAKRG